MKYDVLLHFIGWDGKPDDPQSVGTGIRLSKSVDLPLFPCIGMRLQLVDNDKTPRNERPPFAKPEIYLTPALEIDELHFHIQEGCAVSIFLNADCDLSGKPIEEKGYLPLQYLKAFVEELERVEGYSSPPKRMEEMDDSFSVHFTENIYIENASGEQRLVSAWANIQTQIVSPLGSRLQFDEINRDFTMTVAPEALTPYDQERVMTRVFPNSLHGHIATILESDLLYEVDVTDFEAEVERVTRALTRKKGFRICDVEE